MSATDVDAYVAALAPARAARVGAVVAAVRRLVPGVAESIEYRMPHFRRGERWFAVASQKSYVSLYLGCRPGIIDRVLASDSALRGGKACVNVGDAAAMPIAAIEAGLTALFED